MSFLKNHPFAVESFFESSLVLTFALPKEQLQNLIPSCLQLDTFQDKWAFIAVAMVQVKELRPKGFPKFMGNNFFLIGYRIFVRYVNSSEKKLRGLYIIKSETDKKKMEFLGNIFTHYNYTSTDIKQITVDNFKTIQSNKSKFKVIIEYTNSEIPLPEVSPFTNWKDARKFAGPLPYTFTYNNDDKSVLIIEGVRQNWKPEAINIKNYHFGFLESLNLQNMVLANAFETKNVPYYWRKGIIEKWS
ncbi:DUF2071 domain-containing protein [Spirosoma sp. BT702]|uniref:DUF2071 domain-containing protein n=1 Tax=Spirosoma profusum TaxID=2771354 RepID=A0A926Y0J8_9BACT|nr:DUF2071 domain-containing protein [Spirosoma profusum]MBD2704364.1 DUF2071 domain-containing protein [Spirosoma profusum]